jgi:hypothetical protein
MVKKWSSKLEWYKLSSCAICCCLFCNGRERLTNQIMYLCLFRSKHNWSKTKCTSTIVSEHGYVSISFHPFKMSNAFENCQGLVLWEFLTSPCRMWPFASFIQQVLIFLWHRSSQSRHFAVTPGKVLWLKIRKLGLKALYR